MFEYVEIDQFDYWIDMLRECTMCIQMDWFQVDIDRDCRNVNEEIVFVRIEASLRIWNEQIQSENSIDTTIDRKSQHLANYEFDID